MIESLADSAKYRVREGKGENATIEIDTTIKKEVWWSTFNVETRRFEMSWFDVVAVSPPLANSVCLWFIPAAIDEMVC